MFPSFIQIISTNVWQTLGRQYTLDTSLSTIISPHLFYSVTSCLTITEVTLISDVLGLTVPWCGVVWCDVVCLWCGDPLGSTGLHWRGREPDSPLPPHPTPAWARLDWRLPPSLPDILGQSGVRAELASLQSIILQSRHLFLPNSYGACCWMFFILTSS